MSQTVPNARQAHHVVADEDEQFSDPLASLSRDHHRIGPATELDPGSWVQFLERVRCGLANARVAVLQ
jgi:hypothetical protein